MTPFCNRVFSLPLKPAFALGAIALSLCIAQLAYAQKEPRAPIDITPPFKSKPGTVIVNTPTDETDYATADHYQALLRSPIRTERDLQMDGARRPVELLLFTKVKRGMQVLDVSAGAGYTSQLLALAVGPEGKVWAQREKEGEALTKRLADKPQPNFIPVYRSLEDPVPPEATRLQLVTLVLNYHDIAYLPVDRTKMNKRIFDALQPGGYYVIVDHSALPGTGTSVAKTLHRIEESVVIDEVKKAGFVLDAEAKFLRNVNDERDDIANSPKVPTDKFALRFLKPVGDAAKK
jgi:predicted methyltransferase